MWMGHLFDTKFAWKLGFALSLASVVDMLMEISPTARIVPGYTLVDVLWLWHIWKFWVKYETLYKNIWEAE